MKFNIFSIFQSSNSYERKSTKDFEIQITRINYRLCIFTDPFLAIIIHVFTKVISVNGEKAGRGVRS